MQALRSALLLQRRSSLHRASNVYTSKGDAATFHSPEKEHLSPILKDNRLLRSFVAADNVNSSNLQLLDDSIAAAVIGVRGRARDTPTTVNVRLWRHPATNGSAAEQQLFKAYIRAQRPGNPGARSTTYVRIQHKLGGNTTGGPARRRGRGTGPRRSRAPCCHQLSLGFAVPSDLLCLGLPVTPCCVGRDGAGGPRCCHGIGVCGVLRAG